MKKFLLIALLTVLPFLGQINGVDAAASHGPSLQRVDYTLNGCSFQLNAPYHSGSYTHADVYMSCSTNSYRNAGVCVTFDDNGAEQYCAYEYYNYGYGSSFEAHISVHTVYSPGTLVSSWGWEYDAVTGQQKTKFLGDYQTSWVDG